MPLNHALHATHVMVGRDMHIPWPPGSPAPAPAPVPYLTTAPLAGIAPLTSKMTPSVFADGGAPLMVRGTDIGPMIPHAGPPSLTLMTEMVTSGSKSSFGVSRVRMKDQSQSEGCLAVALMGAANLNLNCGTPSPLTGGIVVAPSTVVAKLSVGDAIAGVYTNAWDYAAQRLLNAFGAAVGESVLKHLEQMGSGLKCTVLSRAAARLKARALVGGSHIGDTARAIREGHARMVGSWLARSADVITVGAGLLVGSPLGMSVTTLSGGRIESPYDTTAGGFDPPGNGDAIGRAIDAYFRSPSVEDVPVVDDALLVQ